MIPLTQEQIAGIVESAATEIKGAFNDGAKLAFNTSIDLVTAIADRLGSDEAATCHMIAANLEAQRDEVLMKEATS